jgi:tRNA threonylcarbamoyladenosine modification (KEOPS) complex  Pcc1 subunit
MNFKVHFSIHENIDHLYDALLPEFKDNKYNRSKASFKKHKDKLEILIEAEDITALKANLNSVINLIEVFNKVGDE